MTNLMTIGSRIANAWQRFLRLSLWLASVGLCIASSGIDGAYLAKLMPSGWGILGLILNTVADVSSEIIMYWYGRLKQAGRKRLWPILVVEFLLVWYAWLFSWRQLSPIVATIESRHSELLAGVMAAFIPVALVGTGYVQSMLAGKVVVTKSAPTTPKPAEVEPVLEPVEQAESQPAAELQGEALRKAILNAKRKKPDATYAELADQFGSATSTIGYHVRALKETGKLNGG